MPNLGFAGRAMAVAAVAVVGVALMPHQGDNRADAAAVDPIRINVGGGEYTDHAGVVWRADAGECDGKTYEVVGRDILNSNEDALFQTRRFGLTQCKVPVPVSGTWKIRLYFAETYFDKDGQREFDVSAEGKRLWRNLDPGDRAGGKDKATMVQASRSIKDGTLDLDFRWVKNQPILSAIELLPPTDTTSDSTTTTTTTLPSTTSTLPEVTTTTIATTVPATVATTKAPSTTKVTTTTVATNGPTTVPVPATVPTSTGGNTLVVSATAGPYTTIAAALADAQPGDTVDVKAGTYGGFTTVRSGTAAKHITINGNAGAKIVGPGTGRLVQIKHNYLTFQNLDISGGDTDFYIQSDAKPGVTGLKLLNNNIHGAGGECVRMKYFATKNEIAFNKIFDCGRQGFVLSNNQHNGEGIYVGTAPEQWYKNPTQEADVTRDNVVHDNNITARAECTDLKEYTTANTVSRNTCTGNEDPNSGAFSSRGDGNTFEYNVGNNLLGAGIRLGGDTPAQGVNNNVRHNTMTNTGNYAFKIMTGPQGQICGNIGANNALGLMKSGQADPTTAC